MACKVRLRLAGRYQAALEKIRSSTPEFTGVRRNLPEYVERCQRIIEYSQSSAEHVRAGRSTCLSAYGVNVHSHTLHFYRINSLTINNRPDPRGENFEAANKTILTMWEQCSPRARRCIEFSNVSKSSRRTIATRYQKVLS